MAAAEFGIKDLSLHLDLIHGLRLDLRLRLSLDLDQSRSQGLDLQLRLTLDLDVAYSIVRMFCCV